MSIRTDQRVSPEVPVQLASEPVAAVRTTSTAIRVKRKPIAGNTSSSTSTGSHLTSQMSLEPSLNPVGSGATPIPKLYPVQYAPRALRVSDPHHGYQSIPAPSSIEPSGGMQEPHAAFLPARQAHVSHARTEPIPGQIMQTRSASTLQPSQQRPHLQQVRTAPPTGAFQSHGQMVAPSNFAHGRPVHANKSRRTSLIAAAKKISHNKLVHSGVKTGLKIGMKYAVGAVIGDTASGLFDSNGSGFFNSNGSSNDVSGTNNITAGMFSGSSSSNDVSGTNYMTSGLFSNNYSNTDVSNTANYDITNPLDSSAGGYQLQYPASDPGSFDQNAEDNNILAYSSIDASQTGYYSDPSQGGQEYENTQQQFQDAQDGLQNAEYNQSLAVDSDLSTEINATNMEEDTEAETANADLAWGSDAV